MKIKVSEDPAENLNLRLVAENTEEEASAMSLLKRGKITSQVRFSGRTSRGTAKKMTIVLSFEEKK
jgi:hypothetical protein